MYIEDLTDYCVMQNWYDMSKSTKEVKWTKHEKAVACLHASLPPAARAEYKFSLGLDEEKQKKPNLALIEYCDASVEMLGEQQKFLIHLVNVFPDNWSSVNTALAIDITI